MTTTFAINSDNDIYLGSDGNLVLATGIDGVANACETISKAQLGEMVLTTGQGIPNFQSLWIGVPNLGIWQSYLKNALLNVAGVEDILDLSFNQNSNTLEYTATIKTEFGITQISG